jgi:hypothetical protein
MWADATQLGQLLPEDFRSHDTGALYVAVANGSMPALPITASSFGKLEVLVASLTSQSVRESGTQWAKQVAEVWTELRTEYPSNHFE